MIPNKYAYLTGCLLFFIPWAALYWHRKDLRRAMLIMGVIGAFGSLLTARYWTVDWWRPETITGTRVGIEDFILGISNAGIATVLYAEIFSKRLYHRRRGDHSKGLTVLVILTCALFWVLFNKLHANSFMSCIVALSVYSAIMLYMRRDLFISSTLNGLLMVLVAAPVYFLMIVLSPDVISHTYIFPTVASMNVFGVPIQEFLFYFVFGFMVALMYEYWQGLRIRNFATAKITAAKKR